MSRFKRQRLAKDLTQAALAKLVGVATSTVNYWETGKRVPEAGHYARLGEIFGMTPEDVTHLFDEVVAASSP